MLNLTSKKTKAPSQRRRMLRPVVCELARDPWWAKMLGMAPSDLRSTTRSPWWHYALVGAGAIILLCVLLPNRPGDSRMTPMYLSRLAVMATVVAVTIYLNVRVLMPRLMQRHRYVLYFIALFLLVVGAAHVVYYLNGWVQELLTGRPARYPSPKGRMLIVFFNQVMVFAGLSALLQYIRSWVLARDLERQKLEAELTALKAQLNPHFLFNSLNNIYSLSLDKSDLAPDYVLKLSELMRYILHDSEVKMVTLREELAFVQSYFDLEGIRMGDTVRMALNVEGAAVDDVRIAPLLLLPFVENAFKHGVKVKPEASYVELTVVVGESGDLTVRVVNSKEPSDDPRPEGEDGNEVLGGVGLTNLQRRLILLYPGRHELRLHDAGSRYEVNLRIEP